MSNAQLTEPDPLQQPELLDAPVSDLHVAQIAGRIKSWEEVAPFLSLSNAEEEEIRKDNKEYGVQKRKALQRWREKKGSDATYGELRDALRRAEEAGANPEWKQFREHLIAWGKKTHHPSFKQQPTLEMSACVDLSLVALKRSDRGFYVDGSDVRLSSVLREEGRQVLIEGPPGSGKTTLTWHLYQQWAEGKLLQQFSLLIPISPSTTGAETTCLADIIPHPSKKVREKVADVIAEKEGKGVCFVVDSWDEVPHSAKWQRSYLYQFLKERVDYSLPHCSIAVTSRPAASSMLRTCATTILRLAEFDSLKIEEFVDKSMDTDSASRFLEILEEKPELHALCHLPLNSTIVVYLYKTSNQELPSTRTKLYKALVDTQLARHWQLRTPDGDVAMDVDKSNVTELLPQEMLTQFIAMCKLAYTGVRGGHSLFDQTAIKKAGLDPLAIVQHVNEYGSDPRRLLVALMNCIYESEVHELYTHVQPQVKQTIFTSQIQLTFELLYLTPSDCLSIGCFLKHTKIDVVPLLSNCNINDAAFKMLALPVIKEQLHYNPYIFIVLDANPITHKGFEFLREGLGSRRLTLSVNNCLRSSSHPHTHVNIFKALANLIECVSRTFSHEFGLLISSNEITAEHKFYLLLLILCSKSLKSLHLNGNNLRGCMPLLAPALNHSNLRELALAHCYLDDNDVICLGKAFQKNLTLRLLYIFDNKISPHAFSEFLFAIQNSAISILSYNGHITVAHRVMLNAINNNRDTAHMSPLHIEDEHQAWFLAKQTVEHMRSLPHEFATGQEGVTNPLYPSESEQKSLTQ